VPLLPFHTELPLLQGVISGGQARTAMTLHEEVGGLSRCRRAKRPCGPVGLVTRVAHSADTCPHGRLAKRSNAELRWIVTDLAAWRRYEDESRTRGTWVSWRMMDAGTSLVLLRRTGVPLSCSLHSISHETYSRPRPQLGRSATYAAAVIMGKC